MSSPRPVAGTTAQDAIREALKGARPDELPAVLADVLAAMLTNAAPASSTQSPPPGRVLTPTQAAQRLGHGPDWAYRKRHSLPTVRLPGGRWGVPEAALERWIKRRSSP